MNFTGQNASTGNEILTEVCLPTYEPAINFSQLNQHCTGHEKNRARYSCMDQN